MQAVQHLTNLRLLELGSNKIRQINGLEPLQKAAGAVARPEQDHADKRN